MADPTTNLGVERIITGQLAGTWGDVTNTNLDAIDQAISGVAQLTLPGAGNSAAPNVIPIYAIPTALADGRNPFIEFVDGGDLGATAFVQMFGGRKVNHNLPRDL
jgi:hypothetical protein